MSARYFIGPAAALYDTELSSTDLKVLCVLGTYLGDRKDHAWPSQGEIADRAGLHRVTVNKSLKTLRARGYVVAEDRSKGPQKALLYRVVMDPDLMTRSAESPMESDVAENNSAVADDYSAVAASDYSAVAAATTAIRRDPIEGTQYLGADAPTGQTSLFEDSLPQEVKPKSNEDRCREIIFRQGVDLLTGQGLAESSARTFFGKAVKGSGVKTVAEAVTAALLEDPVDAKAWIMAALQTRANRQAVSRSQTAGQSHSDQIRRFKAFATRGFWAPAYGPKPYEGDYPDAVYRKSGLPTPSERAASNLHHSNH